MSRICCKDCKNCEMLDADVILVIIENKGFLEKRRFEKGVHCRKFGQFATNVDALPKSEMYDDFIYE